MPVAYQDHMANGVFDILRHDKGITSSSVLTGQALLITTVLAALGLLVIPAPANVLDALFALNFILTLAVLAAGLSATDPVRFSSFPGLILLLTLIRLALGISSSRLILTEGQAGGIVGAFGEFAAGGNIAVGVAVFIILQIVHFLVVSKGSERVAEVAARFTLDALPGKQMSIDADLRAGLIDADTARRKRAELIGESRFYGAMDGAMKFVKGECAAVFAVACVNIAGGFIAGVWQRGLSASQAAKTYALLTLGDGLASELPAFIIAMTAGFLVTRVPAEKDSSLGRDIGLQVFGDPKPLWVASVALLASAFLPGMPSRFFILAAGTTGFLAVSLSKKIKNKALEAVSVRKLEAPLEELRPGQTLPLVLQVSPALRAGFDGDARWQRCFHGDYSRLRTLMTNRIGVPFPELKIDVDVTLDAECYRIRIFGLPAAEGTSSPTDTAPDETLLRRIGWVLKRHAGDFIGIQEVRDILTGLEDHAPELVREVVPRILTVAKLTDIVKRLVEENVPVNDFRLILEILATVGTDAKDPVSLTEQVRIGMKRVLSHRHSRGSGKLAAFLIDPDIESGIANAVVSDGSERFLSLAPDTSSRLVGAFAAAYSRVLPSETHPVVLTHVGIRRYVRKLIENELPDVAVLSYQELEPRLAIETRDTISLEAL